MKLILEKNEIVAILGKHFEAQLDPEKVIIRTDPFEMELSGLPLGDAPPQESSNVVPLNPPQRRTTVVEEPLAKNRNDPGATTETPPPGNDGVEGGPDGDVHPAAVLATSKELEAQLDRENPQLKRRSGQFSFDAPKDQKDEIG